MTAILTPIQALKMPLGEKSGVRVWIKRDDLIHPQLSGNKWRKLQGPLNMMKKLGKKSILTFGGAFSNHLHAVSFLCLQGIQVIVYVPLDQKRIVVPSLEESKANGIVIRYIPRREYRKRFKKEWIDKLQSAYPEHYIIPEGGTISDQLVGVHHMMDACKLQIEREGIGRIDYWLVPVGTGGTLLGMIQRRPPVGKLIGISAVKGPNQSTWIQRHLAEKFSSNWVVLQNHHLGGMGKYTSELIQTIKYHHHKNGLLLDPIYNAKTMLALVNLIHSGYIQGGSRVMVIHTGGQAGLKNFIVKEGRHDLESMLQ